mgnify:FL=1
MTNDELQDGDRVEVYWNLHKDCFSVRKNGRVVDYLYGRDYLTLTDVKFVVQPAGRERVLREGKKNVHAFVRGTVSFSSPVAYQQKASYNPYKMGSFFTKFGGNCTPISSARRATLTDAGVYINP